ALAAPADHMIRATAVTTNVKPRHMIRSLRARRHPAPGLAPARFLPHLTHRENSRPLLSLDAGHGRGDYRLALLSAEGYCQARCHRSVVHSIVRRRPWSVGRSTCTTE